MKLIREHLEDSIEFITEERNGKKEVYIHGIFMQAEAKNRNGRVYPKKVMEKAVDRYIKEQVEKGRSVGELNHPPTPTINLDKVSHLITDLRFEGNDVIGKAKLLDTPMGIIAKSLIEGGVKLGVSSRGLGTVQNRSGVDYVSEDYMIGAVDIVQDPSAQKAFVESVMESTEWVLDPVSNTWVPKNMSSTKELIVNEDRLIKDFKDLLFGIDLP